MTAPPMPLFRMRSDESRRAWLEGWLSAYTFMAEQVTLGDQGNLTEILAAAFKKQLQELIDKENA